MGKIIAERQMITLPPIKILGFGLVKLVEHKEEYLNRSGYFEVYRLCSFSLNKCSVSLSQPQHPLQLQNSFSSSTSHNLCTESANSCNFGVKLLGCSNDLEKGEKIAVRQAS